MTTNEPDRLATPPAPILDRKTWFAQFGYDGAEEVVLRRELGAAPADDVWLVLQSLHQIQDYNTSLWARSIGAAHQDRRVSDPHHDLASSEFGPLTDKHGDWLPRRREIIVALTHDFDDDGGPSYSRDPLEHKA